MSDEVKNIELNEVSGGEQYEGFFEYFVQPNESLISIAAKFHTSYVILARVNNIPFPYFIYIGQKLLIPKGY